MLNTGSYNPDILTCLANLSSDEVFTPPKMANEILDQLPPEIWKDKNARFLDPFCKSGVFPREIARRLMKGLEKVIPEPTETGESHFHKTNFCHRHHGIDGAHIAPVGLLFQNLQRQVFRLRCVRQQSRQHPFQTRQAHLGKRALHVLRGQPAGV